jgi:hypothetical protein
LWTRHALEGRVASTSCRKAPAPPVPSSACNRVVCSAKLSA